MKALLKNQYAAQLLMGSLGLLTFWGAVAPTSQALTLSDLVKQPPQLYLPSQIIPGETATFTLKAKPGRHARLILSSSRKGVSLLNGFAMHTGKPTVEEEVIVPASGVVQIPIKMPKDPEILGDRQFIEAMVWSSPDQSDIQEAQLMGQSGTPTSDNKIVVGVEPDKGSVLILPGDNSMSGVLRSINSMAEVGNDPRKKQLLDNGDINRSRAIDQTLDLEPVSH